MPGHLHESVTEQGVDVDTAVNDGTMLMIDPTSLGSKDGEFDEDLFIQRVTEFVDNAREQGTEHIQNCSSMTWLQKAVGDDPDRIVYLEARLNEAFEDRPISGF